MAFLLRLAHNYLGSKSRSTAGQGAFPPSALALWQSPAARGVQRAYAARSPAALTWAMSSKQLKMYFLASFDLIPVSASWSSGVYQERQKLIGKVAYLLVTQSQTLELSSPAEGPSHLVEKEALILLKVTCTPSP